MHQVNYNGLIADVREQDLEQGVKLLREASDEERVRILASVKRALDQVLKKVARGATSFSPKQRQDIANDIGLWLAGEIIAGRADNYRVSAH